MSFEQEMVRGRQLAECFAPALYQCTERSADPLAFWVGVLAAQLGMMGASIGHQNSMRALEFLRGLVEREGPSLNSGRHLQ